MKDIFERMRAGELIRLDDPDYPTVYEAIVRAFEITGHLNSAYHDADRTREILSELTKEKIDASTTILPPFYTDFGQFIRFGRNVFVNFGCAMMDRGGYHDRGWCAHRSASQTHHREPRRTSRPPCARLLSPDCDQTKGVDRCRGNCSARCDDRAKRHCGGWIGCHARCCRRYDCGWRSCSCCA